MGINIYELNIFYFRTIWFEQTYNPVFQLQQYHSILVPEWCCTSGVLAWESHWHQICVWPTIVQVMGFNSKKNAWNIWKLLHSCTWGCISHERQGMIFNTDIWIVTFKGQCNKCMGLHDLHFYCDRKCFFQTGQKYLKVESSLKFIGSLESWQGWPLVSS